MSLKFAAYAIIKFILYFIWCYIGIRCLARRPPTGRWRAASLGVFRLMIGVGFGALLGGFLHFGHGARNGNYSGLYFAVLVPARWLEWSIMSFFPDLSAQGFWLFPFRDMRTLLWRLGGILISFATDIIAFVFVISRLIC